jgi:hypothetical protein
MNEGHTKDYCEHRKANYRDSDDRLVQIKNLNRSTNIITTNTEYTIDPQSNIEETTLYYYQTLEVGKHHTMDPIMEGILSCSLASSRGHPPIELPAPNTIFLFMSHYIA